MKRKVVHRHNDYVECRCVCNSRNAILCVSSTSEEVMKVFLFVHTNDTHFFCCWCLLSFYKKIKRVLEISIYTMQISCYIISNHWTVIASRASNTKTKNTKIGHEKRKVVTDSKEKHICQFYIKGNIFIEETGRNKQKIINLFSQWKKCQKPLLKISQSTREDGNEKGSFWEQMTTKNQRDTKKM